MVEPANKVRRHVNVDSLDLQPRPPGFRQINAQTYQILALIKAPVELFNARR